MTKTDSSVAISRATPPDCRAIARHMMGRRADEPRFRKLARSRLQRFIYERWAAPRFLARSADTFRASIGEEMAGYLILLYDHPSVVVLDVVALQGFKGQGIEGVLLGQTMEVARQRDYPYVRGGLAPGDAYITQVFSAEGFQPLEFRRWEFAGTVTAREAPEQVTMRPLVGLAVGQRRAHYMQAELDAAEPPGRPLIEAHFLPKRPSAARAFEMLYQGEPFGFLSARPDEGAYVLSLSLLPRWWGHELELAVVAAFPTTAARAGNARVRVLPDTTAHAEAAGASLASMGLERRLADPDIWFKDVESEE